MKTALFLALLVVAQHDISAKEVSEEFAYSSQWLALAHYNKNFLRRGFESTVDDTRFFLAEGGKVSPRAELEASIKAMLGITPEHRQQQCQFPARFAWLTRTLLKKEPDLTHCVELNDWLRTISAESVSLVFPASYLDSPSSMFGHTLLRLNKSADKDRSSLLSYSVSYAAKKSESDSELGFVYRGLVGGYPGDLAIVPYFHKIKEYSEIESRDIWEYDLKFSSDEVNFLMLHLWEVKDVRIDYYFFSENCSYQVMALLNVVRPDLALNRENPLYTIPVATVRQLYNKGLIGKYKFRPSVITQFWHHANQLDKNERAIAKSLVTAETISAKKKEALEPNVAQVAYEYSRVARLKKGHERKRSFELLTTVNKLPDDTLEQIPAPEFRDDEGHESERFALAFGTFNEDRGYIELGVRPAYHDLTDPALGYPIGSELVFSSGRVRLYENSELQLEDYTLIGIKSLKGSNLFFRPTSWAVQLGATRNTNTENRRLVPTINGSLGYGYSFSDSVLVYGLIGAELQVQNGINKGHDVLAQMNFGGIYRAENFKSQFVFDALISDSINTAAETSYSIDANYVYNHSKKLSFELKASRSQVLGEKFSDASLGFRYYH